MLSDLSVERYYYVFDSRQRRPVVMDRETGEEVVWREIPRIQLIEYVDERCSPDRLYAFSRRCARNTRAHRCASQTPAGRLWAMVQCETTSGWRGVQQEVIDAVIRAVTLGVPSGEADGARLLAVYACTHTEPLRAAIDAAHMEERWAEFVAGEAPRRSVRRVRQHQVDWLLDALGED